MSDPVNHPAHYEGAGGVETIEILEAVIDGLDAKSGFRLGNVIKYALRAGKKGDLGEDLAKANNYAHRLVTGKWRWQAEEARKPVPTGCPGYELGECSLCPHDRECFPALHVGRKEAAG